MDNLNIIEAADHSAIARWVEDRLTAALAQGKGTHAATMPGGSTPFPILGELTAEPDGAVDWSRLQVWPNDDRIVPEDHDASNTGKMRALLEPVGATVCALAEDTQPPHFALTWLGMGPDGHTASLFPNTDPQIDDAQPVRRLTPDPLPAHAPFDRITFTLPALLDTDAILLTLGGSGEKREVFDAAIRGKHDLPIARLLRAAAERGISVTCFA